MLRDHGKQRTHTQAGTAATPAFNAALKACVIDRDPAQAEKVYEVMLSMTVSPDVETIK